MAAYIEEAVVDRQVLVLDMVRGETLRGSWNID
jgi:hypothetical protein